MHAEPPTLHLSPNTSRPQLGHCAAGRTITHGHPVLKVRQRLYTDCGVACLAMVAGVPYEDASEAFTAAGLHLKRKSKKPFMSNFRDLTAAAGHLGVQLRQRPFRTWSTIQSPTILKVKPPSAVPGLSTKDWHWVVAHRAAHGIHIEDPAHEFACYEVPPPFANALEFEYYQPTGAMLSIDTSRKQDRQGERQAAAKRGS